MKHTTTRLLLTALVFVGTLSSCDKNNNLSLFSVSNDLELGQQVAAQIAADPTTYPILPESGNEEAYAYLEAMTDEILNSGEVQYKDEFAWEVHIIDQDVLNAFCTPGGYIYVYTGLINYLDNIDDLAGVMGHEIAHADLRHSSRSLQKQYGISTLLSILLGDGGNEIAEIAAGYANGLVSLKFSRDHEEESDARSVEYLASTDYACNGAATFFQKLLADGQGSSGGLETFLSTHPSSDSRVEDINAKADEVGCDTSLSDDNTNGMTYAEFQALFVAEAK
ncbi:MULTISPECIES: M48 family metalloprotease [Reichenbachiella]|uniref:M48 family metalloprotease n=1 Tax=Reichenbachiella TaxID=156993 RepID=UPI000E6C10D0|nr:MULTISPECIES: M48 family metalloprotease [Reichenbachiella]MBU2913920.1 M48 family metalloprotease [Reichenbachiella agariperforans]RJE74167.1 peptidase M48 [Reichenbachiella sp. MSK19-1]